MRTPAQEPRTLTHEEARRVYDRIGALQDTQAFYEDRATEILLAHGAFGAARNVFEFGCGTGRLAARLLAEHLPSSATYRGVDVSPNMVALARERTERFGKRATLSLSDGSPPRGEPSQAYDRFVSCFVFDLLSDADIDAVLHEGHRMLVPGGLLCLTSLSTGSGPVSRMLARAWSRVHALRPELVGGCRPIDLGSRLADGRWRVLHRVAITPFGIPSEAVIAARQPTSSAPPRPEPQ